jgi:hypothetical protein
MSEQNVEVAERMIAAFNHGDWELAETLYWPEAEAQAPEGWPEAIEVDFDARILATYREGKILRIEFYFDGERAKQATGL